MIWIWMIWTNSLFLDNKLHLRGRSFTYFMKGVCITLQVRKNYFLVRFVWEEQCFFISWEFLLLCFITHLWSTIPELGFLLWHLMTVSWVSLLLPACVRSAFSPAPPPVLSAYRPVMAYILSFRLCPEW